MTKASMPEEVLVLRFFETGPIDKVEAVFNIVCEKMRERGRSASHADETASSTNRSRRQQQNKPKTATSAADTQSAVNSST